MRRLNDYRPATFALILTALLVLVFQNCAPPSNQGALSQPSAASDRPSAEELDLSYQGRSAVEDTHESEKSATSTQDLVADRRFVQAMLKDIFGDTVMTQPLAAPLRLIADFGGNCSTYENYTIYNDKGAPIQADIGNTCAALDTAEWLSGAMIPGFTVKRAGALAKACESAVMSKVTFPVALAKIGNRLGASGLPEASPENLKNLILLFYRNHGEPPPDVIESLGVFFTPGAPKPEEWQAAIFATCVSSHWQVI